MLLINMNSKRQRRPNVRLGEVGDVSAAFACGFPQKSEQFLGFKSCNDDFLSPDDTEHHPKQSPFDFIVSEAGVCPRNSADLLQNRENNNPNSAKSAFEFVKWEEIDMTKSELNFGNITRKCRVMRRRGRGSNRNYSGFGSVWSTETSPRFSNEDGNGCGMKELVGSKSDTSDQCGPVTSSKDSSDHETQSSTKETCENDDGSPHDMSKQEDFNDTSTDDDACKEGSKLSPTSGHGWDEMEFGGDYVNTVTRWLEEQGFGRYSGIFEMHEVDEEALPLLTLEDLKEMGVIAVGTRRKLYTAIQKLRTAEFST
ncbi:hypothetical protein Tsubulata_045293, partial [Turnera subulata]